MSNTAIFTRSLSARCKPGSWYCKQSIRAQLELRPKWILGCLARNPSRALNTQQQLSKGSKQIPRKKFRPTSVSDLASKGTESQEGVVAGLTNENQLVTAYCVAQSYDINRVHQTLLDRGRQAGLPANQASSNEPEVIHLEMPLRRSTGRPLDETDSKPQSTGDVFIFSSGTVVSWGVPRMEIEDLTTEVLLSAATEPLGTNAEEENLEYIEDPQESKSLVRGETIVLGTKSDHIQAVQDQNEHRSTRIVLAKLAYSSGLARATKLAVLENLVDEYSQSSRSVLSMLNGGPMARLKSRRWIYQRFGHLLDLRAQLNLYSELADDLPDLFWDTKQELGLENYYHQVGQTLDVLQRIKILNQKMDYAEEIIGNLRDMRSEIHSSRLEWIIIWLIAFEVLHTIWIEVRRLPQEREKAKGSLDLVTVQG